MAKKSEKKAKKGPPQGDGAVATLGAHPRASRDVLRGRGWGGLIGFTLVFLLSLRAGAPLPDVALRALIGGVVGSLVGWTAAVVAWRTLANAEIRAAHRRVEAAMQAAEAQKQQATA